MNKLSIIICTRNRAFILTECLESLLDQTVGTERYELIAVDNNSTDETKKIIDQHPKIRYVFEPKIGLSVARNTGFQSATSNWVGYIDDDAKAHANLVERALWIIDHWDFDAFGGIYHPWYKYGKPHWLPDDFGKKEKLLDATGYLTEGYLSGGIFFIKKNVLEDVGGFSENLGMRAGSGYAEEDELQLRLRNSGYKIGFDPELAIDHCVMPHKLKLSWHLTSEFAKFRDRQSFLRQYSKTTSLLGFIKSALAVGIKIPLGLIKLIFSRNYYWQHIVLDAGIPVARRLGVIRAAFAKKK